MSLEGSNNLVTEEDASQLNERELSCLAEGVRRADRWANFGAAIAVLAAVLAGVVWMIKP